MNRKTFLLCALAPLLTLTNAFAMEFKEGQVWSYRTRPGEGASTLLINKVETYPKIGQVFHISLDGLAYKNRRVAGGVAHDMPHFPVSKKTLDASVLKLLKTSAPNPAYQAGYAQWKSAFDAGNAGVFDIPVAEIVGVVESALAQEPVLAPNAPEDKPVAVGLNERFERSIAPYVARARASYPQARERFLQGLPKGESFFVTTRLRGADGSVEQVFIAVQSIRDGQIMGRIWSEVNTVKGYKHKDPYTFPEERLLDWLITKPDGSEEGNFVGKFLDTYKG